MQKVPKVTKGKNEFNFTYKGSISCLLWAAILKFKPIFQIQNNKKLIKFLKYENNDLEEGVVVQEIQTGYMMYDRLLRPAMVGVSKKTKQESESAKDQDLKSDKKNIEKDSKN